MDWKNVLSRAGWTFLEGFLAALPLGSGFSRAALLAAVMAGLSAVKTMLTELIRLHNAAENS